MTADRVRHVITFTEPVEPEAMRELARLWREALDDRARDTILLSYPAHLVEINVPPRRSVRVKNAQRRLR